mmetsp:Transcript_48312/g.126322  ORF Transcript_48312/g.126322 Transcript_48312/m.126322 type:complete len:297 (-) Transcript_48312:227-1117(-)
MLELDLNVNEADAFETMAPITPGRPPSPRNEDEDRDATEFTPVPPPPRESQSVPASFQRRKLRASARWSSSLPSSLQASRPSSALRRHKVDDVIEALPSRDGTSAWIKPSSAFGKLTSSRQAAPSREYGGKETRHVYLLGSFGPGMYDVRCSKMGSPLRGAKGTPSFTRTSPRFGTKAQENLQPGQFGPGMYEIRCSKNGSPVRGGKMTPRFVPGRRFDRENCYEGKETVHVLLGRSGALGSHDPPRCSRNGSPLWNRGSRPGAAFALPHVRMPRCANGLFTGGSSPRAAKPTLVA